MTQNRVVTTTVQYVVNTQSVAQVQAASASIVSGMQAIPAAATEVNDTTVMLNGAFEKIATNQAFEKLAQDAAAGAISFQEMAEAAANLGATEAEINKLASDIDRIQQSNAGGDGGGSGLGGLRGGLRATGFLLGSEAGGQVPRALGQAITLESAFGGVGVIVAGVALATRALSAAEQEAEKAETSRLAVLRETASAIATSTQEEVKARLQAAQQQLQIDQQVRDNIANTQIQVGNVFRALVDVYAPLLDPENQGKATSLKSALGEQDAALVADKARIEAYTTAINNNATAVNDATAAEEARSKQQASDAGRAVAISNMTADARKTQADEENNEIKVIGEYINAHHLSKEAITELTNKQYDLIADVQMLTDVTHTYGDTLADVSQRADAVNNLFSAITAEGAAMQKVADAQQAVANGATEHADKLREIQTNEQDKEAADRQKAAQQAENDQAKHLQKLAEIDAQYNADHEAAVGNRDALANFQAAQKRDDATSKENAAYTLQEQQLQAHLDQELAADRAAQQKQIDAENASYAKRNAQLIRALNDAQVEESRAAGLELAYQRQANDAQLNERIRANAVVETVQQAANVVAQNVQAVHQNAMANIAYAGGALLEQIFAGTWARLAALAANPFAGAVASGTNPNPFAGAHASADSYIRGIVNNQVARIARDVNR